MSHTFTLEVRVQAKLTKEIKKRLGEQRKGQKAWGLKAETSDQMAIPTRAPQVCKMHEVYPGYFLDTCLQGLLFFQRLFWSVLSNVSNVFLMHVDTLGYMDTFGDLDSWMVLVTLGDIGNYQWLGAILDWIELAFMGNLDNFVTSCNLVSL